MWKFYVICSVFRCKPSGCGFRIRLIPVFVGFVSLGLATQLNYAIRDIYQKQNFIRNAYRKRLLILQSCFKWIFSRWWAKVYPTFHQIWDMSNMVVVIWVLWLFVGWPYGHLGNTQRTKTWARFQPTTWTFYSRGIRASSNNNLSDSCSGDMH